MELIITEEIEEKEELPQEEAPEEVEESPEVIEEIEEDERPTDPQGWKKLREKKKAAQAEAEANKKLAEEKDRQLSELREGLARLEGREEARAKPEVKEVDADPEPDAYLDPDLHIKWEIRQINKRAEAAERRAQMAEEMAKVEGTRRGGR